MAKWRDLEQEAKNGQWQRYLESLVGRDRPVSVAQLDEAIRNLTQREGDARNEIYAYLRADQKVGAKRAFWIGEALRECGIPWSSGVIALAVASHFKELVALFALLSLRGEDAEACAVHLAAVCAVMSCEDPGDGELVSFNARVAKHSPGPILRRCSSSKMLGKRWRGGLDLMVAFLRRCASRLPTPT